MKMKTKTNHANDGFGEFFSRDVEPGHGCGALVARTAGCEKVVHDDRWVGVRRSANFLEVRGALHLAHWLHQRVAHQDADIRARVTATSAFVQN
jgi:hypothetical protein